MTTPDRRPPPTERPAGPADVIRAEIESSQDRRITFARFMEIALYEPGVGYYKTADDRPTRGGDFLTAPETHPIFGWTLARRVERMWAELGRPGDFHILEYGAGSGTLAITLLEGLARRAPEILDSLRYCPVEANPNRLAELASRFETAGLARLLALPAPSSIAAPGPSVGPAPVTGVLIANEFLDALPVHRVVLRNGELREIFVTWRGSGAAGGGEDGGRGAAGGFVQVVGEPSTSAFAARLSDEGIVLAEGQAAEICLGIEPWVAEVSGRLDRGFGLLIDYGYEADELYGPRHLAGTLLGYRSHRVVDDPLLSPGSIDLTAHVDFTAVRRAAERHGFRTNSPVRLSEFLLAAGLESEWETIRTRPDIAVADYAAARSAVLRLLDPRHLGAFRVLTLER